MELIQLLHSSPITFGVICGVLGLLIGSFLNVVIHRLPLMLEREWQRNCAEMLAEAGDHGDGHGDGDAKSVPAQDPDEQPYNLVVPRSRCPHCGHPISALENIPVLSYLALRGRCKACSSPISARYPLIEGLTALLSALVAWRFGFGIAALGAMGLTWALIALSFIDLDRKLLPDNITLPLLWLGLGLNVFSVYAHLHAAVIGAIAGYGVLWLVFHAFRLVTGKEGMGYGDFKLTAAFGAWMGWTALPLIIVVSAFTGAVVGVAMIAFGGHERNVPIPFGPYLAVAGWIYLMWGPNLMHWYLGVSGLAGN